MFQRSSITVSNWESFFQGKAPNQAQTAPAAVTRATRRSRWGDQRNPAAQVVADYVYSSSPGFLASIDDFYIVSGGFGNLAIIETSLDVYSDPVISKVTPQSVLCWMRGFCLFIDALVVIFLKYFSTFQILTWLHLASAQLR